MVVVVVAVMVDWAGLADEGWGFGRGWDVRGKSAVEDGFEVGRDISTVRTNWRSRLKEPVGGRTAGELRGRL